mmetsp:Transcript_11278/g.17153  ORF Transcript_11278/g.17153 Transcript_11278/m.17153 type:complete len:217 (-) Transcript_11278:455-1105(-)
MQKVLLRRVILGRHKPISNPRGKNTSASKPERKSHESNITLSKSNSCDDRTNERLEEISSHTSHVTNIITDIISNDSRITGIVLRNTLLNLTNKISTYVSCLGVDATSDTGKKGNRRSAESKTSERFSSPLVRNSFVRISGCILRADVVRVATVAHKDKENGHSKKAKSNNTESHHSTSRESNTESSVETEFVGGMGRTCVGIGGNNHTNPTSSCR